MISPVCREGSVFYVCPKQIVLGQFVLNSVIFFYEEKDWSTEIENVILDPSSLFPGQRLF